LLKCNTDIEFNKQCLTKWITSKYAMMKVSGHKLPATHTKYEAPSLRIRNEVEFFCLKKQLNKELYSWNLINVNEWDTTWNMIDEDKQQTMHCNEK
jgi:hypothetical protein